MTLRSLVAASLLSMAVPALADTNNVTVVHAIPGGDLGLDPTLPVDLCLILGTGNEAPVLEGVTFGAFAGLSLPPGFYNLNIRLADDDPATDPCTGAVAVPVSFTVSVAESSTVVAHLSEQGTPTFTKYVDDLRSLDADRGRVVVRHAAAAPPVKVSLKGRNVVTIQALRAPDQSVSEVVRAGRYRATIFPADGGGRVFGPAQIDVVAGQTLFIHAVGSLSTGSFTVILIPVAVP